MPQPIVAARKRRSGPLWLRRRVTVIGLDRSDHAALTQRLKVQ